MMDSSDFDEQREELLDSIEKDQQQVRVALQELSGAAGAAGARMDVAERIRTFPLTWTLGAFLVGVWLGSRGAARDANEQRRQR